MLDLKNIVRRQIGFRVALETKLRVTRAVPAARLKRREIFEADRALRVLGRKPAALVATIVPTYRRHEMLRRAVESVLAQSVTDQVVLVIDDGGGLPSLPEDSRLFSLSLTRNTGVVGVVRNVGIRLSDSKFLAFLDDDNEWAPNHLEVSLMAHADAAELTYTAMQRVLPDGSSYGEALSWPFNRERLRNEQSVDASTIVVRRDAGTFYSRLPRRKGEGPREDWELIFRLSRRMRTVHVPVVTVRYLVSQGSYFTAWSGKSRSGGI